MIIEIRIPGAGESITEVAIGNWLADHGSRVEKDQEIAEVETDKATLPLIAPESGQLNILVKAGDKVQVGDVACTIDTEGGGKVAAAGAVAVEEKKQVAVAAAAVAAVEEVTPKPTIKATPLAKNIMQQHNLDIDAIIRGLRKITRQEVEMVISNQSGVPALPAVFTSGRDITRTPMSPLRRKLSKRLVSVKNETAMLTTFNEVDMSAVMDLRRKYQSLFQEKHGQKLGLVSFFTKACAEALALFPRVNSMIDGDDILTPGFIDIAIAVQTDKGLMVPVIRDVQHLSISRLEIAIAELAQKARIARLSIEEMTGGTFTITNGGVFGSMLSTPILNPPQSAILGMHNITERPVVISGNIVVRPMMYLALSYDHRLIDGRDSVSFLVKVKEFIESPLKMLKEGEEGEKLLLDL
ncbi:MAG: 2-oxoglutarate dehydrogenase complex dihydrolipoyllysine-residue succinyltransferase [Bacteroidales bacterium]|nr:2-oxoglutarate dehydrogenase complex dihydrolipoyllysine-residue succinyltransferase [Bacteroidales bacterium]